MEKMFIQEILSDKIYIPKSSSICLCDSPLHSKGRFFFVEKGSVFIDSLVMDEFQGNDDLSAHNFVDFCHHGSFFFCHKDVRIFGNEASTVREINIYSGVVKAEHWQKISEIFCSIMVRRDIVSAAKSNRSTASKVISLLFAISYLSKQSQIDVDGLDYIFVGMPITHQSIAYFCGSTRVSVSRTMKNLLKNHDIIRLSDAGCYAISKEKVFDLSLLSTETRHSCIKML